MGEAADLTGTSKNQDATALISTMAICRVYVYSSTFFTFAGFNGEVEIGIQVNHPIRYKKAITAKVQINTTIATVTFIHMGRLSYMIQK